MQNRIRIAAGLVMVSLTLAGSAPLHAQPPKPSAGKTEPLPASKTEPLLFSSLRDVINHGASLYNDKNDPAGCYRVYQGALIAVRPYLADDPKLLDHVDTSLQKAEKIPKMADRAFALRAVIDSIRDIYRPKANTPTDKKPVEVIPPPKKEGKVETK